MPTTMSVSSFKKEYLEEYPSSSDGGYFFDHSLPSGIYGIVFFRYLEIFNEFGRYIVVKTVFYE